MPLGRLIRRYGDWLLALGLAVLFQIEVWTIDASQPGDVPVDVAMSTRALAAPAALAFALSLAWRRRAPLATLAVAVATIVFFEFLAGPFADAMAFGLGLVVALYSVGAHTRGLRTAAGSLGVVVLVVFAGIEDPGNDWELGNLLFFVMLFGGPWLAGRAIRYRRERETALETRTVELEHEREEKARAAVAEERARIARELHDVVAHAISVIVVQARGGRRSLAADPDEAREAFDSIETTGQQALSEMRRLLGMLRRDDKELALSPQPSMRHVHALAAQMTEAGLPVQVSVEGEETELPPGIDVSAYRIVQESLTNVLKHAGPATARVTIRYGGDELEVEIADTGTPRDNGGRDAGHGLVGMRERVALYGGDLEAGRSNGGGFAVRARLPLDSTRS